MCFEMKTDHKGARQVKCTPEDLKFRLEMAKPDMPEGDLSKEQKAKLSAAHCTFKGPKGTMMGDKVEEIKYTWDEGKCVRNITFNAAGKMQCKSGKFCDCLSSDFSQKKTLPKALQNSTHFGQKICF
jgi:hypothetical protein